MYYPLINVYWNLINKVNIIVRYLVLSKMSMETFGPWFHAEYRHYSNCMNAIFFVIHDKSWISHLFLFFFLMNYSEIDEWLLSSTYQTWLLVSYAFCELFWWYQFYCISIGVRLMAKLPRTWVITCLCLCYLPFHTSRTYQSGLNASINILDRIKCPLINQMSYKQTLVCSLLTYLVSSFIS